MQKLIKIKPFKSSRTFNKGSHLKKVIFLIQKESECPGCKCNLKVVLTKTYTEHGNLYILMWLDHMLNSVFISG